MSFADHCSITVQLDRAYQFEPGVHDSEDSLKYISIRPGVSHKLPQGGMARQLYCMYPMKKSMTTELNFKKVNAEFVFCIRGCPDNEGPVNAVFRAVRSYLAEICYANNIEGLHMSVEISVYFVNGRKLRGVILTVMLEKGPLSERNRNLLRAIVLPKEVLSQSQVVKQIGGWLLWVSTKIRAYANTPDPSEVIHKKYISTRIQHIKPYMTIQEVLAHINTHDPSMALRINDAFLNQNFNELHSELWLLSATDENIHLNIDAVSCICVKSGYWSLEDVQTPQLLLPGQQAMITKDEMLKTAPRVSAPMKLVWNGSNKQVKGGNVAVAKPKGSVAGTNCGQLDENTKVIRDELTRTANTVKCMQTKMDELSTKLTAVQSDLSKYGTAVSVSALEGRVKLVEDSSVNLQKSVNSRLKAALEAMERGRKKDFDDLKALVLGTCDPDVDESGQQK